MLEKLLVSGSLVLKGVCLAKELIPVLFFLAFLALSDELFNSISAFLDEPDQIGQHHEGNRLSLRVSVSQWLSTSGPSHTRLHQLLGNLPVLLTDIQRHDTKESIPAFHAIPVVPIFFVVTLINSEINVLSFGQYFTVLFPGQIGHLIENSVDIVGEIVIALL